jgi:predicted CXXCH cytochrome family protein
MAMRHIRKAAGVAVMVCVAALVASLNQGCSKVTRYKIKTFFFTGVPPLEDEAIDQVKRPHTLETLVRMEKQRPKIVLYSHTPYAQGLCAKCHQMPGGTSFRIVGNKKGAAVFRKGGGMPGPLRKPKNELCVMCHTFFTPATAKKMSLWLHAPKTEAGCNVCHDPHQSKFPNQMHQKPSALCVSCHPRCPHLDTYDMREVDDCLTCHNPHVGRNRMMLRQDFKEEKHPVDAS